MASASKGDVEGPFRLTIDEDGLTVRLLFAPPWSGAPPRTLMSHRFGSEAVSASFLLDEADPLHLAYLGRLGLRFGSDSLAERAAAADEKALTEAREQLEEAEERERLHRTVEAYATEKKGVFLLDLRRGSRSKAEWSISFRGRSERDRLRDWLRWQRASFLEYLEFAAEHGGPALERRLVDAMFAAERKAKAEGRSAGGVRPLRMWRGEE